MHIIMANTYESPEIKNNDEELDGVVTDEKGTVETKEEWEEELKRRKEDPNWWRERN